MIVSLAELTNEVRQGLAFRCTELPHVIRQGLAVLQDIFCLLRINSQRKISQYYENKSF